MIYLDGVEGGCESFQGHSRALSQSGKMPTGEVHGMMSSSCMLVLYMCMSLSLAIDDYCIIETQCPGPESTESSQSDSVGSGLVYRIGGMFSISQWDSGTLGDSGTCSACVGSRQFQLFAIEQAESLILAVESIKESGLLGNRSLVYSIWDTCGDLTGSASVDKCILMQTPHLAHLSELLATVVGPYYTGHSFSMEENDLIELYSGLGSIETQSEFEVTGKGVWSLLDYPYQYSKDVDERLMAGSIENRLIMLQQTCELQATAAVDFLVQEGWYNVIVVASEDYCGFWALRNFHLLVEHLPSYCLFDIQYVQEKRDTTTAHALHIPDEFLHMEELVKPYNYSVDNDKGEKLSIEQKKNNSIVILSSIPYALSVLERLKANSNFIAAVSILLGDLWGDPRNVNDLYSVISDLVHQGHQSVYGLRFESNDTAKFHSYMANLTSNSSQLLRNRWLREYWEDQFHCSISNGTCRDTDRLPYQNRPILRNYKASLVMYAVYATATYIRDFHADRQTRLTKLFELDFYNLGYGQTLTVTNEFTRNTMILGRASVGETEFEWIQPFNWTYEFVVLRSGANKTELEHEIYGKWTLTSPHNGTGVLQLSGNRTTRTVESCNATEPTVTSTHSPQPSTSASFPTHFPQLSTSASPSSFASNTCDDEELYTMAAVVSIVTTLLLIVSFVYFVSLTRGRSGAVRLVFCSLGKVTLIVNSLASITISFWITFSGVAFQCDNLTADFLVNIVNTACYSTIYLRLFSQKFHRPLNKLCIRCLGFVALVGAQALVSGLAHSKFTSEPQGDKSRIIHCFEERQKPLVVVSYWFSIAMLAVCVLFYFLYHYKKEENRTKLCVKMAIALVIVALYVVFVSCFLWADENDCLVHAQFLIIIALYPSLVCLVMVVVVMATYFYKDHIGKRVDATLPTELDGAGERSSSNTFNLYLFPGLVGVSEEELLDEEVRKEMKNVLIKQGRLILKASIGKGNFGEVFKGVLDDLKDVAVKTVRDVVTRTDVNSFIKEGLQMKNFKHQNVMELIGICWLKGTGSFLPSLAPVLVLPYMEMGDLKGYLRNCQPGSRSSESKNPLTLTQSVKFIHQIAKGMQYIGSQGIIHRDLAARNCMVNMDLDIKVSDFGLARALKDGKDYYRAMHEMELPIRWMAPESLMYSTFTFKSDIWSYGVTVWEVMTLAEVPYQGLGLSPRGILSFLKEGNRLDKPTGCPKEIYGLMTQCWQPVPADRPSFDDVINKVEDYLTVVKEYFIPGKGTEEPTIPYANWRALIKKESCDISSSANDYTGRELLSNDGDEVIANPGAEGVEKPRPNCIKGRDRSLSEQVFV